MMAKQVLLGYCPIGKFVFSHEEALRFKGEILRDWTAGGFLLWTLKRCCRMESSAIRSTWSRLCGIFATNGSTPSSSPIATLARKAPAAMIAKKCGVPTLLWGPRDEAPLPDGTRLRDSLCGMLAASGVLHALGVPFTYIENCGVDEAPLRRGVDRFVRAVGLSRR